MGDGFLIQSPEEWEGLGVGEDDMDPSVAWVAAEDPAQARTMFRAFLADDDEYAIQLTRTGCIRGTLRDAREAAHIRDGCRVFRFVSATES